MKTNTRNTIPIQRWNVAGAVLVTYKDFKVDIRKDAMLWSAVNAVPVVVPRPAYTGVDTFFFNIGHPVWGLTVGHPDGIDLLFNREISESTWQSTAFPFLENWPRGVDVERLARLRLPLLKDIVVKDMFLYLPLLGPQPAIKII